MKKIHQRKNTAWAMIAAIILIYMGLNCLWIGATHKGKGLIMYGGDEPGTGGGAGTQESLQVVSQEDFKRHHYLYAAMFLFFGVSIAIDSLKRWKKQDDLEKMWERTIVTNIDDIKSNPGAYREDFREWINQNYPHLKT